MKLERKILGLLVLTLLNSCQIFDDGRNELIKEYFNPKQSLKLIVFEKYGNATTNNSIQASIHDYNYKLTDKEIGNIFVADQIKSIKTSKDSLLNVKWIDNETIEVVYPVSIRTFKTEKVFKSKTGEIKIDYKTTNE